MLKFLPLTHTYTWNGVPVPSVTQALCEAGIVDTQWYTEYAARRGSEVHKAIHFYNDGDLDEESLDPVIVPYIEAYKCFLRDTGAKIISHERMVFNEIYHYAGTYDVIMDISGKFYAVDFKTGCLQDWVGLQLAGYELVLANEYQWIDGRMGLQLKPQEETSRSKPYKFREYKDMDDYQIFKNAVSISHWKRRKKAA